MLETSERVTVWCPVHRMYELVVSHRSEGGCVECPHADDR